MSLAQKVDASYIIIATHGHSGVRRLIVGSVTEDVIRRSTRPVLVIRSAFNGENETDTVVPKEIKLEKIKIVF